MTWSMDHDLEYDHDLECDMTWSTIMTWSTDHDLECGTITEDTRDRSSSIAPFVCLCSGFRSIIAMALRYFGDFRR